MAHVCTPHWGAKAKIYLAFIGLVLGVSATRAAHAAPFELPATEAAPGVVVYPARVAGARAITVVLHGMCGQPQNACRHFAEQVTETQHLICPRASQRCAGGGSSWPQRGFAEQIEAAVTRGQAALRGLVDAAPGRTLIGYSLGALRALDLAQQSGGRYPRVMLIGAKIYPNRKLLKQSGVERLLLSAGAWDMMHDHMLAETKRLSRGGFPVRFLGLGPVGHFFSPSFAEYLPRALSWLAQDAASGTNWRSQHHAFARTLWC